MEYLVMNLFIQINSVWRFYIIDSFAALQLKKEVGVLVSLSLEDAGSGCCCLFFNISDAQSV